MKCTFSYVPSNAFSTAVNSASGLAAVGNLRSSDGSLFPQTASPVFPGGVQAFVTSDDRRVPVFRKRELSETQRRLRPAIGQLEVTR